MPCTSWLVAGCLQVCDGGELIAALLAPVGFNSGRLWHSHVDWQFQPQQVLERSTGRVLFAAGVQPQVQQQRVLGKGCVLGMSSVRARGVSRRMHG